MIDAKQKMMKNITNDYFVGHGNETDADADADANTMTLSSELWTKTGGAGATNACSHPLLWVGVPGCSRHLADKDRSETETATGNDSILKDRKEESLNSNASLWDLLDFGT